MYVCRCVNFHLVDNELNDLDDRCILKSGTLNNITKKTTAFKLLYFGKSVAI